MKEDTAKKLQEDHPEKLSESMEDYLETILALQKENRVARVKDIADRLEVLRGSVTSALKNLAEKGLINYEPYSFITLTDQGKTYAEEITRRHTVIRDFLQCVLLMDPEAADQNACRMEHAMDREAIDRLVGFIQYLYNCPRTGEDWIDGFRKYFSGKKSDAKTCASCLDRCLARYQEEEK